jgi:hypothetical protein
VTRALKILSIRGRPQNRDLEEQGLLYKVSLGIFGFLMILGIVGTIINSLVKIWNGEILEGIIGLIPVVTIFFLLIASLSIVRGGGKL